MVYFITNKKETVVKIGFSANPKQRLRSLQHSNYDPLKIYKLFNGDFVHEKFLHDTFSKYKIRGEFFTFSDEIKNFLNTNDTIPLQRINYHTSNEFGIDRDYIKFYYDNFVNILIKGDTWYKLLFIILKYCKNNEPYIYITKNEKKDFADLIGCNTQSVSDTISKLYKNNVLIKKARCIYAVNPIYAFKGSDRVRDNFINELNLR